MVFRSAQGTAWSAAVAAIRSSMLQKHCPHTSLMSRPLHSAATSCSTAKIKAGRGECERHNLIRGVTNPPTPRHTKLGGRPGVHALCGRAGPAVPPGSGSTMPTNGGGIIYDDSTIFRKRRFFSTSSESLSNIPPPPLKLTTAVRCRTSKVHFPATPATCKHVPRVVGGADLRLFLLCVSGYEGFVKENIKYRKERASCTRPLSLAIPGGSAIPRTCAISFSNAFIRTRCIFIFLRTLTRTTSNFALLTVSVVFRMLGHRRPWQHWKRLCYATVSTSVLVCFSV